MQLNHPSTHHLTCLIVVCLLLPLGEGCLSDDCLECDTYLNGNNVVEICSRCRTGTVLKNDECVLDEGLVIGISLAAVALLIGEVIVVILCNRKYATMNKVKADITLE